MRAPNPARTLFGISVLAGLLGASSAQAATTAQRQEAWRASIAHTPVPDKGCYTAAYPLTVWTEVACVEGPDRPYIPRSGHGGAQTTGDGNDYAAVTATPTSSATGSFLNVKGLTSETDGGRSNVYSIQLNSNFISNDEACSGAADPTKCLGWVQFLYSSSESRAFMQYWLIHYNTTCPSGWHSLSGDCWRNSKAVKVPTEPITDLPKINLSGTAVAAGLDTLKFTDDTLAYSTTGQDSVMFLAAGWNASEFNVVGDGSGSQADFNVGTSLAVRIDLTDGSNAKPVCQANDGTTGETNNLNLGACSAKKGKGLVLPSVQFGESLPKLTLSVLYAFAGGSDGIGPDDGLIADKAGNLYGTTVGSGSLGIYGTVFRLAPDGTETVLYRFSGGSDGRFPEGGVIADKAGNLYGTTYQGGGGNGCGGDGCGTVFKLAPDGTETVLYRFSGGSDGALPEAGLIVDQTGNLYGVTSRGGNDAACDEGCGTVFRLAPNGTETVVHAFAGSDGATPLATLLADKAGNLYGTTYDGGTSQGTVFRITPDGVETVLHAFSRTDGDGIAPWSVLILDNAGNLYGTTKMGGAHDDGIVFRLSPDGTETILYTFAGGSDGANPMFGLIPDQEGNLYGITQFGGVTSCFSGNSCGTIFKLAPDGTKTVVHAFAGGSDGITPSASLVTDKAGNLYGETLLGGGSGCGGDGCGTVFVIKK